MSAISDLDRLIEEYQPKIEGFFKRRGLRNEELEDFTQDTILKIIEASSNFRGRSAISTWIYAICQNNFRSMLYKKRRNTNLLKKIKQNTKLSQSIEDMKDLEFEIDKLSKIEKNLYHSFYLENRKIREIAQALKLPEGTVKYKLYAIRKKIRAMLR